MNLSIVKATLQDIPTLNILNREVQDLHHALHPNIFKPGTDDAMTDVFEQFLANESVTIWLAKAHDGQALGYTAFEFVERKERGYRYAYTVLLVHHLAVAKAHHGHGIGTFLMQAVDNRARELGTDFTELSVWAHNAQAIGFYERLGFRTMHQTMMK